MAAFKHTIEHTPMDWFEAITCIGKCPPNDDRHGVIDVGSLHFMVERMVE
jgi:hypothetical protein